MLSLSQRELSHRVISDKVHGLFVTLSYFRPDRFVQVFSLIPILILLLYIPVSIDLVYTGIQELVLALVQKEDKFSLRFIQIVLVLKLQVVSALTNNFQC